MNNDRHYDIARNDKKITIYTLILSVLANFIEIFESSFYLKNLNNVK